MVAIIQSVFSWALDRDIISEHNIRQIKPIKRPKDKPRANRPWTREEWNTVTTTAPPHHAGSHAALRRLGLAGVRARRLPARGRTTTPKEKKIKRVSAKSGVRWSRHSCRVS